MTEISAESEFASLDQQYGIPPDKYCGLTPEDMSRSAGPSTSTGCSTIRSSTGQSQKA